MDKMFLFTADPSDIIAARAFLMKIEDVATDEMKVILESPFLIQTTADDFQVENHTEFFMSSKDILDNIGEHNG